jgi:hypothetical protein
MSLLLPSAKLSSCFHVTGIVFLVHTSSALLPHKVPATNILALTETETTRELAQKLESDPLLHISMDRTYQRPNINRFKEKEI